MLVPKESGILVLLYFPPSKICFWRRRLEVRRSYLREGFLACSSKALEIKWSVPWSLTSLELLSFKIRLANLLLRYLNLRVRYLYTWWTGIWTNSVNKMTACISIARYKEFSLPFEMLSSCRLVQSPPYASDSDASYIQVFSATGDALGGEGEKSGSRHLAAHCDSALAGAVAWGLQLPGTSPPDTTSSVCAGDPAVWLCSSSARLLYWQERQRPAKCSFCWVQISRELPWRKGSSPGNS